MIKEPHVELIEVLERGYPKKYAPADLEGAISKIIQSVAPAIAEAAEGAGSQDMAAIWKKIRGDERVRKAFAKAAGIDRAVAIYVASKFENNQYIGSNLVQATSRRRGGS